MKTPVAVLFGAWVVAAFLVVAAPVLAHHSGAGFDSGKTIELTGTVKEFQFTNPHTWLQMFVEDGKGGKVEWSIEWGSPNSLGRQGVRPSTFAPGAKVTVRLNPMVNGSPAGGFVGAKLADGKTLGRWEEKQ